MKNRFVISMIIALALIGGPARATESPAFNEALEQAAGKLHAALAKQGGVTAAILTIGTNADAANRESFSESIIAGMLPIIRQGLPGGEGGNSVAVISEARVKKLRSSLGIKNHTFLNEEEARKIFPKLGADYLIIGKVDNQGNFSIEGWGAPGRPQIPPEITHFPPDDPFFKLIANFQRPRRPELARAPIAVNGQIVSLEYSRPGGRNLVIVTTNGEVSVYDTITGNYKMSLETHDFTPTAAAYSAGEQEIVVGGRDGKLRVYDAESGEKLRMINDGISLGGEVASIACDEVGRLAAASQSGGVTMWNLVTGKRLPVSFTAPNAAVRRIMFSPDRKRIAAAGAGGVSVYDAAKGGAPIQQFGGDINDIDYSDDGFIAGAANDMTVKLWNTNDGSLAGTFEGHKGPVRCARFSRNSLFIISGSDDGSIMTWVRGSNIAMHALTEHASPVRAIAYHPSGEQFASGAADLRLWGAPREPGGKIRVTSSVDVESTVYINGRIPEGTGTIPPRGTRTFEKVPVGKITFSVEGRGVILHSNSASSCELMITDGKETAVNLSYKWNWTRATASLSGAYEARALAVSPDGKLLAAGYTASRPGEIAGRTAVAKVWSLETGQPVCTLNDEKETHKGSVNGVAWSADGKKILTVSDDRSAKLWTASGAFVAALPGTAQFKMPVQSGVFDNTGSFIAIRLGSRTGGYGLVKVYDAHTLEPLPYVIEGTAAAFDRSGKLLVGKSDGITSVYEPATGGEIKAAEMKQSGGLAVRSIACDTSGRFIAVSYADGNTAVFDAATKTRFYAIQGGDAVFAPDGGQIYTSFDSGRVEIADTATGRRVKTLPSGGGQINALAVSSAGGFLAAACGDGSVRCFDRNAKERVWFLYYRDEQTVTVSKDGYYSGDDIHLLVQSEAGEPRPFRAGESIKYFSADKVKQALSL